MHFGLLDKANFVEKKATNSSGIYIGKRTSHDMQASLKHPGYELFARGLLLPALGTMYHLQHPIAPISTSSLAAGLG